MYEGTIHYDRGDFKSARKRAEEAVELALDGNERHYGGLARILLGRALLKTQPSAAAQAESSILRGLGELNELRLRPLADQGYFHLGEFYADTGVKEKALENLTLIGGKYKNQMFTTPLVWDPDVNPEGAAETLSYRAHERVEELVAGYECPVPHDIREGLARHFHDFYRQHRP